MWPVSLVLWPLAAGRRISGVAGRLTLAVVTVERDLDGLAGLHEE